MASRPPTAPPVTPDVHRTGLAQEIARLADAAVEHAEAGRTADAAKLWAEADRLTLQLAAPWSCRSADGQGRGATAASSLPISAS
jgi:hypothetical protein